MANWKLLSITTKRNVFFTFWHYVLFLVNTVYSWCRFRLFSLHMYVITVLSTIYFVIIRLGAAALFNTLQQCILLLLASSWFAIA